jgi:23S rRNA pseudouridine1911/1915/1917 synthase
MMHLQVLFEDNHLIAVNKPGGYLVQGDRTGDIPLAEYVKDYIKVRYGKPGDVYLGVIHRLDRPVSGATVFARTSKALERMNKIFRDRQIDKTYLAIVNEQPKKLSDTLVHYIHKDHRKNRVLVLDKPSRRHPDAKRAELSYEVKGRLGQHTLLEVKLATGRPHQIRAQLAKIGSPIRGDLKYGSLLTNEDGNICLHCRSLAFVHPVRKEPVKIVADPPQDEIWGLFAGLIEE